MVHMMPEDPAERAFFDKAAKLYGGPLPALAESLANWSKANPSSGSLSKLQAIMSNEARREHRRVNRLRKLLRDLHPHVMALAVSDEAPEFSALLKRVEELM